MYQGRSHLFIFQYFSLSLYLSLSIRLPLPPSLSISYSLSIYFFSPPSPSLVLSHHKSSGRGVITELARTPRSSHVLLARYALPCSQISPTYYTWTGKCSEMHHHKTALQPDGKILLHSMACNALLKKEICIMEGDIEKR